MIQKNIQQKTEKGKCKIFEYVETVNRVNHLHGLLEFLTIKDVEIITEVYT